MVQGKRISLYDLLIGIVLIYSIVPIVGRIFSEYLTTYSYLLIVFLLFFLIVIGQGQHSINEYVGGLLLPFIAFNLLTIFVNTEPVLIWGYAILLNLLPIVLGYYIIWYYIDGIKAFSKLILLAFIVTAITTIVGLIQFPYAARELATLTSESADFATFGWHNIGGYGFVYKLVLLYPILIMAFKQKKISIFTTVSLTTLIFSVVILSEYTTALLLLVVSSILFFVKRNLKFKDVIILLIIAVLVIVLFNTFFSTILRNIGSLIGSETMAERLNSLAGGQNGLEGSESNRIELYKKSWDLFLANPIAGNFLSGGKGVGGHSFILDILGRYGCIGGSLLFFMYRKIYRAFFQPFRDMPGYGFMIWAFLQTIILSFINTGMHIDTMTLVIPIFACVIHGIDGFGNDEFENK